MIKYLFADRDGTIIYDKHYLSDPKQVELIPSVVPALQKLQQNHIQIFLVTNQSGIGRGYFQKQDLLACHKELENQLMSYNVKILDMAYCPHSPEENCACRKPHLGMWEYLQKKYQLDPLQCAMIGDKKEDVLFGINANFAYSCLVQTGKGKNTAENYHIDTTQDFAKIDSSLFSSNNSQTQCFYAKEFTHFINFLIHETK